MSLLGGNDGAGPGRMGGSDLVSLLYRSRATVKFDQRDLDALVRGARLRNRQRDVTGALYYEDGRFFQWIEGAPPTVSRLFGSIGRDGRHTDVEVVSFGHTLQRVFADWDLRLYRGFDELAIVQPPRSRGATRGLSEDPEMLRGMAIGLARGRVGELSLALQQAGTEPGAQVLLCERLMRCYADLWERDDCTELDIVLGLGLAQAQFRLHRARMSSPPIVRTKGATLVLPFPGERHLLGASLVQASLEEAGHAVPASLPESLDETETLLQSSPCGDAVVVVSGVLARPHQVDRLAEFTGRLRRLLPAGASVTLYGRLAGTGDGVIAASGCDSGTRFALRVPRLLGQASPSLH